MQPTVIVEIKDIEEKIAELAEIENLVREARDRLHGLRLEAILKEKASEESDA